MISDTLWVVLFLVTCASFVFSLFRTYYNWRTLKESRQYWESWKQREENVVKKVLKKISDDEK